MMKYTFFPKSTKSEIDFLIDNHQEHDFELFDEMINKLIDDLQSIDYPSVFLVGMEFNNSVEEMNEIYIHESGMMCEFFVSSHIYHSLIKKVFLMQCDSYESAYKLALDLREGTTDLCYQDQ